MKSHFKAGLQSTDPAGALALLCLDRIYVRNASSGSSNPNRFGWLLAPPELTLLQPHEPAMAARSDTLRRERQ